MLSVLGNTAYRHLFLAQVFSLLGSGLTTVALSLLAYDLAGDKAGQILGTALAIKMVAYVGLAPVAGAISANFPRKRLLVGLDLVRAGFVLLLPFVSEIWQIYVLIFLFQACSAVFTPTFQATIPDILKDEKDYTNGLSMSRLAYDLESLLSPTLAGLLLSLMSFHWLFVGNGIAFGLSAALVVTAALPTIKAALSHHSFGERLKRGIRIYLRTPRLRGLLCLSVAVSSAGAMVIVNSVVYAREIFGGSETDVAILFAAYGGGSMVAALALPRLLDLIPVRTAMIAGAVLLCAGLAVGAAGWSFWGIVVLWAMLGLGSSSITTPTGLLLKRSSHTEDRPALFAAQFALSHACWLISYPLAGWLVSEAGFAIAFTVLAACVALSSIGAMLTWPAFDPDEIEHVHAPVEHIHPDGDRDHHDEIGLTQPGASHSHSTTKHKHKFVIDDHHPIWPR